jgi:hypothetical protein
MTTLPRRQGRALELIIKKDYIMWSTLPPLSIGPQMGKVAQQLFLMFTGSCQPDLVAAAHPCNCRISKYIFNLHLHFLAELT